MTSAEQMCHPLEVTPISTANDVLRNALPLLDDEKRKLICEAILNEDLDEEDEEEPEEPKDAGKEQHNRTSRPPAQSTTPGPKPAEPATEEEMEAVEEMLDLLEFVRLRNLHPSGATCAERQSESDTDKKPTVRRATG